MRSKSLTRRFAINILEKKAIIRELSVYILAIILCLIILSLTLNLWKADLSIPFSYSGDSLQVGMCIKSIIDNGWYLNNTFLGAPTSLSMYDIPIGGNLEFLILKVLSLFTQNYGMVLNIFFLLTFPLTTITSLYVLRQFNLSYAVSVVFSLLYTFISYHFLRGENHLFLSSYYVIPLIIMVILWVYTKDKLFFTQASNKKYRPDLLKAESIVCIIICILISSSMGYYTFFSCFFLLVAGISSSILHKSKYPLLAALILISIIVIGLLINVSPTLLYQFEHGKNVIAGVRAPQDAEVYGLKIVQLFMPVSSHRLTWLANLTRWYDSNEPLVNENVTASLGVIGSIGFILSLLWMFIRISGNTNIRHDDFLITLTALSICNISAVLLGTIGGFESIVSMVYPQIRAYNRISIFIAFFSLFTLALLLEWAYNKYLRTNKKMIFYGIMGLILLVGILDQTNASFVPNYSSVRQEYSSDDNFVHQIEAIMPENAMIYELPYMPYPETPPRKKLIGYDLFKGYLHSTDLKWSYGSIKGREGDLWEQNITKMPMSEMLGTLSSRGFDGIYVDSYGYEDSGKNITADLSDTLGVTPIVSNNKRLFFFDMTDYDKKIQANTTSE